MESNMGTICLLRLDLPTRCREASNYDLGSYKRSSFTIIQTRVTEENSVPREQEKKNGKPESGLVFGSFVQ